MSVRRIPRLAAVSWAVAVAALAGLGVAVAHYLGSGSSGAMAGMSMPTSSALTRGGDSVLREPLFGSALVTAWQLDSVAVAFLVLLGALYLTGVALVPVRSPGRRWPVRRTAFFVGGLLVAAFATNGSIAVYDQVLFSAHMLGHLALVMVAPALLVAGAPVQLLLDAAPPERRERLRKRLTGPVVSVLTSPPVALAVYTVVIVGSHLTGIMDTIMTNAWAGQVEHLVYLAAGVLFFGLVVGDHPIRWHLGSPARWLLLAIGMAVDTFTGIVLMQGTSPVMIMPSALHVNALSDTRTGGAIMWLGGDAIMAVIMVVLVIGYLRSAEIAAPERGWLAQARVETFSGHTGAHAETAADVDDDDTARDAYNEWLGKLSSRG